ncbi:Calpain catalytic domain-containing protein [Durusdinium trenchii]|uniref:Calpain catalytic domain-containing protein n=1 Tax=Durusdinium trenchii TaxID=1381693 RepID=A0ABP0KM90_9DINO
MLDFDELEEIETQLRASFPDVKTDQAPWMITTLQVTDVKVPPGQELRIFLISDLHVDYKQNKEWMYRCLQSLSHESSDGRRFFDCLLLPGDLCTSEDLFEEVMKTLKARFHKVFFCFGDYALQRNHEAWIRGEKKGNTPAKDSFEKLERIHEICKDGNEVWIKEVLELQSREGGEILSYSHFCPRQELILEKRFSYDQHVPKISGSSFLEQQIRRAGAGPVGVADSGFGYASMYPEMKEALKQRNLLSAKVDGPDGMSPFFPGGALNNNGAFWLRHASANLRWRLPPLGLEALRFPCENPGCLLCRFTAEQEAKEDVSTVG